MTRFNTPAEMTVAASALRRGNLVDIGLKTERYARVQGEGAARKF